MSVLYYNTPLAYNENILLDPTKGRMYRAMPKEEGIA